MKVLVGPRSGVEAYGPLVEAGHQIEIVQTGARRSAASEELLEACRDADIALGVNLPHEALVEAKKLRALVTTSIGIERIDLAAASALGVLVCNSPSPENYNGVAEATVGMMVAMSKLWKRKEAALRDLGWGREGDRGSLLAGRTLGLIGLGRIALGVAKRLQGWDMEIIAYSPRSPEERFRAAGVKRVDSLDDVFRIADYVSVHVVATPETERFIGEHQLRLMKPTAYLVNTARGQVIDEAVLIRALQEEWFAGAALDVFAEEPLAADSPLRAIDPERLILTPHSISHTWDSRTGGLRMAMESTLAILAGEVPETVVNPEAVPAWRERFG